MNVTAKKNLMSRVLSLRDFRFLFAGSATSLLGDQFTQAISSAVIKWSLEALFVSAGVLILLVVLWAASQPGLKVFSEGLATANQAAADD